MKSWKNFKKITYGLVFLLLMTLGINKTYAANNEIKRCYYGNSDLSFRAFVTFYEGEINPSDLTMSSYTGVTGRVRILTFNGEGVGDVTTSISNIDKVNSSSFLTTCPSKLSVGKSLGKYFAYINDGAQEKNYQSGENMPSNQFFGIDLCSNGKTCEIGKDVELNCSSGLFGNANYAGENAVDKDGRSIDENGNGVIDPPSVAYIINRVLGITRIIAIALLIVLGTLDMGKAVLAGKEDEMKKAQSTFVKRIIACICVFLAPVFVRIVMSLANMAWDDNYKSCTIEEITANNSHSGKF